LLDGITKRNRERERGCLLWYYFDLSAASIDPSIQATANSRHPKLDVLIASAAAAAAVSVFLYNARAEKVMYLSFMRRHSSIMK